nr:hypothetical protein [Citrobacter freundii]
MAVAIGDQVVSPSKGIFAGNKAGDDVKIPVLADQFQRDSFLVTPDISLGVLGNVLQAVFKGIQNSDGADGVCATGSRLTYCFTLIKPAIPLAVAYRDRRCRQRRGLKLPGQREPGVSPGKAP